ncbi:MAG: hypothetical protein HC792_00730, partial [Acaryochloridaceae cyanobacterium CSU_5_19]|nr:hypothetical protein [Acaryochloridaceae cyanobacterium CSU_5_19]
MVKHGISNCRVVALGICISLGQVPLLWSRVEAQSLTPRPIHIHSSPSKPGPLNLAQDSDVDLGLESEMPGVKPLPAPNPAESLPAVDGPATKDQAAPISAPNPSRPISPRKEALIRKLLVLTEQRQTAEDQFNLLLADMEKNLPELLAGIIGDRTNSKAANSWQKSPKPANDWSNNIEKNYP